MLKIFTDVRLLSLGNPVELLIPFIGIPDYDKDPDNIVCGRFDEYLLLGKKYIQLTNFEECDVYLLPVYYPDRGNSKIFDENISSFVNLVKSSGKKIVVFTGHDIQNVTVNIHNAIIFNGAINKSQQRENVFSWPHFFEDFLKKYYDGKIPLRKKSAVPVVGFCGFAPPVGLKFGKEKLVSFFKLLANYAGIMKRYPSKSSHSYRARAILALRRSEKVACNFIIKPNFAFGPGGLNTGLTTESHEEFRKNFVYNIVESDYTLCVRGIGNNSIRFFETLCCGRIPVFINTNSVLPFDHIIDWKKYCVWVEEKDIDKVGDIVNEFHQMISDQDFVELQKKLRRLWEEYLSPSGFFKNIKLFIDCPLNEINLPD